MKHTAGDSLHTWQLWHDQNIKSYIMGIFLLEVSQRVIHFQLCEHLKCGFFSSFFDICECFLFLSGSDFLSSSTQTRSTHWHFSSENMPLRLIAHRPSPSAGPFSLNLTGTGKIRALIFPRRLHRKCHFIHHQPQWSTLCVGFIQDIDISTAYRDYALSVSLLLEATIE